MEPFNEHKVNCRSRESMLDELNSHYHYITSVSGKAQCLLAHQVKIRNLGLRDRHEENCAFNLLNIRWPEDNEHVWPSVRQRLINLFEKQTGNRYTIKPKGRNGGYLVLYPMFDVPVGREKYTYFNKPQIWPDSRLRDMSDIALAFDCACRRIIEEFSEFVKHDAYTMDRWKVRWTHDLLSWGIGGKS